jgi:hypothetical protein
VGVAGYGCVGVGMGHAGFLGKWGGEREGKNSGKNFKNSLLPCLCIQNGTVRFFFFLKKRKKDLGVTQKWVMTIIMFLVFKCVLNYNKPCCHLLLFMLVGIRSQQFLIISYYMLFNNHDLKR